MAVVYLARDLRHVRDVAVKIFQLDGEEPGEGSQRFLQEIQIAARLSHPNILPLHDSGEVEGLLYYVMPYVPGESLRQRLDREGALPVADALPDRPGDRRRAGLRPQSRRDPPGHQAGEHSLHLRPRRGRRLRHRPRDQRRWLGESGSWRARPVLRPT